VVTPLTKASLKEYRKQKQYNCWEFTYDPVEDQLQAGSLLGGGGSNTGVASPGSTGINNPGTGVGSNPTTNTNNNSGGSSSSGSGSNSNNNTTPQ